MNKVVKKIKEETFHQIENINTFGYGFLSPWRGAKFLFSHPNLYKFATFPVIINIIIFSLGITFGTVYFFRWVQSVLPGFEGWWSIIFYAIIVVFVISILVIIYFSFTAFSHIIAAPFNDLLSEQVELKVTGEKIDEKFSWKKLSHDSWRTIKEEIKKISIFGLLQVIILIFNLIPVIGQFVYAALSLTITWFVLAFEYLDIPMDRNKYDFFKKIKILRSNVFLFLGFGFAASLLILVPILNLIFLPICVITGTLLYTDIKKHGKKG